MVSQKTICPVGIENQTYLGPRHFVQVSSQRSADDGQKRIGHMSGNGYSFPAFADVVLAHFSDNTQTPIISLIHMKYYDRLQVRRWLPGSLSVLVYIYRHNLLSSTKQIF